MSVRSDARVVTSAAKAATNVASHCNSLDVGLPFGVGWSCIVPGLPESVRYERRRRVVDEEPHEVDRCGNSRSRTSSGGVIKVVGEFFEAPAPLSS